MLPASSAGTSLLVPTQVVSNCPRGGGRGMVHTPILRLQADIQNRVVACVITRCACCYIATPVLLNVYSLPRTK